MTLNNPKQNYAEKEENFKTFDQEAHCPLLIIQTWKYHPIIGAVGIGTDNLYNYNNIFSIKLFLSWIFPMNQHSLS